MCCYYTIPPVLKMHFFMNGLTKARCKCPFIQTRVKLFSLLYSGHVDVLPDITVHPSVNSYQLLNLRSGSIYCVVLSAFTAPGEGKRSEPKCFETMGKFFPH